MSSEGPEPVGSAGHGAGGRSVDRIEDESEPGVRPMGIQFHADSVRQHSG